ncbi:MAG TPA: FHA domain-containing protein, partial [Gemmataceae bacterium]|nr:FHA domain-containing protein [Gemmataceae bacterium]
MNDPLIVRFAEVCGATGPLDLRVDLPEGGVLAEGSVHQPFTLIGRDDACDVTLTDPEVNLRHAWLQVIGGRVYAVDLGSRTGLVWPDGQSGCGWLAIGTPVRVGPFRIHLRSPPSPQPAPISPSYDPLRSDPTLARARPSVFLEFRNGKRAKDRWAVNRVITLVGQSEACKIHLNSDDIASHHCALVLTPVGLWVVDLSGRGVVVNGERMRVAPLPHGAELWVGRFLIGCHYPAVGATPPLARPGTPTPPTPLPGLPASPGAAGTAVLRPPLPPPAFPPDSPAISDIPEDEVPLGFQPPTDPAAGLPSSHIMADAFRVLAGLGLTGNGGPVSSP